MSLNWPHAPASFQSARPVNAHSVGLPVLSTMAMFRFDPPSLYEPKSRNRSLSQPRRAPCTNCVLKYWLTFVRSTNCCVRLEAISS